MAIEDLENTSISPLKHQESSLSIEAKTTKTSPHQRQVKHKATVIFGDPRLAYKMRLNGHFNEEDLSDINEIKKILGTLNHYQFEYLDEHHSLIQQLLHYKPDFVFNLCDEGFNNLAQQELHVPALLEMLNIPYTGAGPTSLAICFNKSMVNAMAQKLGVPVPLEVVYHEKATLPTSYPLLVKPNKTDGSFGITQQSVVYQQNELEQYLQQFKQQHPHLSLLIQEYLQGAEYSIGLIGNPGHFKILPLIEVDYSQLPRHLPKILSYEFKWLQNPDWDRIAYKEAELPEEIEIALIQYSQLLFEHFECRDYARFDFRADKQGNIKLLEVNPNPGLCGEISAMIKFAGISDAGLLESILEAALKRLKLI